MVEENPDGHPAVDAWLALDSGNSRPAEIHALYAAKLARKKNKNKRKSAVYRLDCPGHGESVIVAKMCAPATAALESKIYEKILPELPISSLRYYGHVTQDDRHWIFIENAGGMELDVNNDTHLELATRWLAAMHTSTTQLDTLSQLPDRGPPYYLSQLHSARQRMKDCTSNSALGPADFEVLEKFCIQAELLESRWSEIESFCETIPASLVHNDFVSKNVHICATDAGQKLFVFDWEMSGKGTPAVDLYWMFQKAPDTTITRYWNHLKGFNSNIGLQDIEHLAILGVAFRVLDAVEWASYDFLTTSPHKKVLWISRYTNRLKRAFHALGWS